MSLRHMKRLEQLKSAPPPEDVDDEVDNVLPTPRNRSLFEMVRKARMKCIEPCIISHSIFGRESDAGTAACLDFHYKDKLSLVRQPVRFVRERWT
mgnify:CR=1 FL=1